MAKATDKALSDLHGVVASALMSKIKSGEATGSDLAAAIKFLKDNNITAAITPGDPLDALKKSLPQFDDMDVDG